MLDKAKVKYLAELAKIELDEKQVESLLKDLNKILDYVSQIQRLNLDKVEPMIGGPASELILREDVGRDGEEKIENSKIVEQIIENFPERNGRYLKVPKVLEKDWELLKKRPSADLSWFICFLLQVLIKFQEKRRNN